jgi:hypothetical protein
MTPAEEAAGAVYRAETLAERVSKAYEAPVALESVEEELAGVGLAVAQVAAELRAARLIPASNPLSLSVADAKLIVGDTSDYPSVSEAAQALLVLDARLRRALGLPVPDEEGES